MRAYLAILAAGSLLLSNGTSPHAVPGQRDDIRWIEISDSHVGTMRAAIATPLGHPPFPAVLLLHGTHGFAREYVELARDLSRQGILAVAACWFSGGSGAGRRFVTPIDWPAAPPLAAPASEGAQRTIGILLEAVRHLPGARPDRTALFGHSRGGGAALAYALSGGAVSALVLDSTGYPDTLVARLPGLHAPVLILHGARDGVADGGSEFTNISKARAFEAALRTAGKPVDASYYSSGTHNGIFENVTQRADELRRIAAFLRRASP